MAVIMRTKIFSNLTLCMPVQCIDVSEDNAVSVIYVNYHSR